MSSELKVQRSQLINEDELNNKFAELIAQARHAPLEELHKISQQATQLQNQAFNTIETNVTRIATEAQKVNMDRVAQYLSPLTNSDLQNLIFKMETQELSRPEQLDIAHAIFKFPHNGINAEEAKIIDTEKQKASRVLSTILKTMDPAQIEKHMVDRIKNKDKDPSYIPGEEMQKITELPQPSIKDQFNLQRVASLALDHTRGKELKHNLSTSKGQFNLQRLASSGLGHARGKVLIVKPEAKHEDQMIGIKYLTEAKKDAQLVSIDNGKFTMERDNNTVPFDTKNFVSHDKRNYAAFVVDTQGKMYVFSHHNSADRMAHSSILAGRPVLFAGECQIEKGELKGITAYSGHYRPDEYNVVNLLSQLKKQNIDIDNVNVRVLEPLHDKYKLDKITDLPPVDLVRRGGTEVPHAYNANDLLEAVTPYAKEKEGLTYKKNQLLDMATHLVSRTDASDIETHNQLTDVKKGLETLKLVEPDAAEKLAHKEAQIKELRAKSQLKEIQSDMKEADNLLQREQKTLESSNSPTFNTPKAA